MMDSLQNIIAKLEDLFSKFNEHFFSGELQKPIITVSPETPRKNWSTFGWCTSWKAWNRGGDDADGYYEINMCAEHLNRSFPETCSTLIHEMVHLWNLQQGVQDTSRSGLYHNTKFKTEAELRGLEVEKGDKYGWHKTKLTPEALEYIQTLDGSGFELARTKVVKGGIKKQSARKYVCPICGTIVRATKEVRVSCSDCDELMLEEGGV